MAKWKAQGFHVRKDDGPPFYVCKAQTTVLAAQIEHEHNSHDALVKALYEECHHCTGDENEYPDICGKCGTGAALALAEVKP